MYDKIKKCADYIRTITDIVPKTAVVLGSGLGEYIDATEILASIPYGDIKGFPISTVAGHMGRFVFANVSEVPVVFMQGRVHYYEGYDITDVVLPIRVMRALGAEYLILTNAAGGINPVFRPGDFMLLRDHISCFLPSPLIGSNIDELGVRFPDMSSVYSIALRDKIKAEAAKCDINLFEGVYLQTSGPNYETPAEIRMFSALGADAVGMSTACEAIAANHAGMKIVGISCISNLAAGISKTPLTHEEVTETTNRVKQTFKKLLTIAIDSTK
ncbi:MAG: purine-nucleoside phosphorylase [Clostridiales bacterium]|nr:purine-nucleoside phosphorylase [Clostridiales bacterium]